MARWTYRLMVLCAGVALAGAAGCNNYGKELKFKNVQLFYQGAATEAEAKKLGEFLNEIDYNRGGDCSVQLDKTGDTYQIRLVIKDGTQITDDMRTAYKVIATAASGKVFNNAPVEIHVCDTQFKILETIKL
jgi:hypothetical protein